MVQAVSVDCLVDLKWYVEVRKGSVALAAHACSQTETDEEIDQ